MVIFSLSIDVFATVFRVVKPGEQFVQVDGLWKCYERTNELAQDTGHNLDAPEVN